MALFYTEGGDLNEKERRIRDSLIKEAQKIKPDEKELVRLRGLLEGVRKQLGHIASESGRLYAPEPQARPLDMKSTPMADPSAALKFRQHDTGAALRIDRTDLE